MSLPGADCASIARRPIQRSPAMPIRVSAAETTGTDSGTTRGPTCGPSEDGTRTAKARPATADTPTTMARTLSSSNDPYRYCPR